MIPSLVEVFAEAAKLPEDEQCSLAEAIRAEIRSDENWDKLLTGAQDEFEHLADEALADHRAGRTKPIIPERSGMRSPPVTAAPRLRPSSRGGQGNPEFALSADARLYWPRL